MNRALYFNQDNHQFYGKHPPEDMTAEGLDRLVDTYAEGTQVAGILFCVNVQRALFESRAWETFYGDYDLAKGNDQPAARRQHGVRNLKLLAARGIDHHARWLARCQHHGIEGWLTMRMNDAHGLEYFARLGPGHYEHLAEWPSTFWREHPELRRAPYRWEGGWEGAFDYAQPAVRDHHLKLVREVFERYDMFGFEMDWLRWGMMFAPGGEQAGRAILTEFVGEVRRLADAAAKRVGHPVRLAHRVPAEPATCLALGFDVPAWAAAGWADMVTLSSFLGNANFDYPIGIWRGLLGDQVKLLALAEPVAESYPGARVMDYPLLYGAAASALQRGADGIYLFNECYRENDAPELLRHLLTHVGGLDNLRNVPRRQAVTFPQVHAPGEALRNVLPIPLRFVEERHSFGRRKENLTLRIPTGPRPWTGRAVLHLGFSPDAPVAALDKMEVRLNTRLVSACAEPHWTSVSAGTPWHDRAPGSVGARLHYDLPLAHLHDDVNVIELVPPDAPGTLEWAEILLLP